MDCTTYSKEDTFTLHVHDLTVAAAGGGDVGGDTDEKAAKPVTTVPDCTSTFVRITPLDF